MNCLRLWRRTLLRNIGDTIMIFYVIKVKYPISEYYLFLFFDLVIVIAVTSSGQRCLADHPFRKGPTNNIFSSTQVTF